MTNFFQTLVSGLSLGSIYALIALGYTMVYGIAKMLNFAHGDIIMVGAYSVIATAMISQNIPGLVAVVISIAVCTLLGVTIEFFAYRPLRKSPSLAVLITAIGISYLLQNLALLIFGSEQKSFRIDFFSRIKPFYIGGVLINGITFLTLIVTFVIMVALSLFINKTRMGKAMRAVSEDREAAELMGINVNRTITLTFAIGSALAEALREFSDFRMLLYSVLLIAIMLLNASPKFAELKGRLSVKSLIAFLKSKRVQPINATENKEER